HSAGQRLEGARRVDDQRLLMAPGDDDAGGKPLAKLRWEEQAPLVVEARRMRSQEHRASPPLHDREPPWLSRSHHRTPLSSTIHPLLPELMPTDRIVAGQSGGAKWGGT